MYSSERERQTVQAHRTSLAAAVLPSRLTRPTGRTGASETDELPPTRHSAERRYRPAASRTCTAVSASASGPGTRNASGTSIQAHRAAVATASSTRALPPTSRTASRAASRRAAGQSVSDSGRAQARRATTGATAPIPAASHREQRRPGQPRPGERQVGGEQQRARQGDGPRRQVAGPQPTPQRGEVASGGGGPLLPRAAQDRARRGQRGRGGHQRQAGQRPWPGRRSACRRTGSSVGPKTSPGSRVRVTHPAHPLSPEVAMPSTRNRWKARKNSKIGSSEITDIANIGPNADWLEASTNERSASGDACTCPGR